MTPIIVTANRKGGVGKTTIAVHLAAALAHQGQRVCIVDTDPQGHVAPSLSLPKQDMLYALALGEPLQLQAVQPAQYAVPNVPDLGALYVLPGAKQTAAIPLLDDYSPFHFSELCHQLIEAADLDAIIVDTAPTHNLFDAAILFAATHMLYVTESAYLSLDGLNSSLSEFNSLSTRYAKYRGFETQLLGVVPNKTILRTRTQRDQLADLATHMDDVWYPIPHAAVWQEASSYGMTVFAYAPDSREAQLGHRLATQFQERIR